MCDIEPVEPYDVPLPEREVSTEALAKVAETDHVRSEPFQVVHLSDMHIDPEYAVSLASNKNSFASEVCPDWFGSQLHEIHLLSKLRR